MVCEVELHSSNSPSGTSQYRRSLFYRHPTSALSPPRLPSPLSLSMTSVVTFAVMYSLYYVSLIITLIHNDGTSQGFEVEREGGDTGWKLPRFPLHGNKRPWLKTCLFGRGFQSGCIDTTKSFNRSILSLSPQRGGGVTPLPLQVLKGCSDQEKVPEGAKL